MFDSFPEDHNDSIFAVCLLHKNESAWLYHRPTVDPNEDESTTSAIKAWNIVKFLPEETYKIKKGDTIKFGRVRFKIASLHTTSDPFDAADFSDN